MNTAISEKWILACLALSTLLASLGMSIANVALPTLSEEFAVPIQTVQWVVVAYLLAVTAMIVNAGKLGDIFGRKNVLLWGIGLFTLASLFCGLSTSFWMLLISRGVQGAGAAVQIALTMAYVQEVVAKEKIGMAMGLLGTMSALGTMLSPTLGGLIISSVGWHSIFFVFIPLGVIDFILAMRVLPNTKATAKPTLSQLDLIGTFLLTTTLLCYALAVTLGKGNFHWQNLGLVSIALIGFALFLFTEKKVNHPLLDLRMFKNKKLRSGLLVNAIVSTVMMSTLIVGPFYLTYALGFQENVVGLILSIGPLVSSISGVSAGRLVDKLGSSTAIILGLLIMVAATFSLALLPIFWGLQGYIVAIVFLTPGYQLFLAANNTDVMSDANQSTRGVISGILNLSRNLGFITGATIIGAIFALAAGTQDIATAQAETVIHAMKATYLIAGVLVFVAFIFAVVNHLNSNSKSIKKQ